MEQQQQLYLQQLYLQQKGKDEKIDVYLKERVNKCKREMENRR